MGKNIVRKIIDCGGSETWRCPGGVTKIKASVYAKHHEIISAAPLAGSFSFLDISKQAYGIGRNDNFNLGDGTSVPKSSPVAVTGSQAFISLSMRQSGNLFLKSNGEAYSCGSGAHGQLGDGSIVSKSTPVLVLGGLKFKKISSGSEHSLALTYDGKLYAWGYNGVYNLGDGTNVMKSSPVLVLGFNSWGGDISASYNYNIALDSGGYAWGWGANNAGQLGLGDTTTRSSPELVLGFNSFKSISAGQTHAIGVTKDGNAFAWGSNNNGQLGDGTVAAKSSPVPVLGGIKWKKISCGNNFNIGLTTDGILYGWGVNANGQLGLGDVTPRSSPVLVLGLKHIFSATEYLLSEMMIDVVPGNYYALSVNNKNTYFGTYPLYGDTYIPHYLVLEYEA